MKTKILIGFSFAIFLSLFIFNVNSAEATITAQPAMDGLYSNATAGPGAIIPTVRFMLQQPSGTDTLTKVGFYIRASSTMSQGEISRVSLWQESGTSPNFQVDQDTFIAGAASTSPMITTGVATTSIVLTLAAPLLITSTPMEFYIVATTTSTIGDITNGHAFDITMDASWASTTPDSIVGAAFTPQKKITLEQTIPVLISEVRFGATGNSDDEFIELYNPNSYSIDLQRAGLQLYIFNPTGGAQNKTLTYFKTVIQESGYFLIGSPTNYSGSIPLDATYSTLDATNNLVASGGFSIATSSLTNATSSKVDLLGWDTQPAANCGGGACFGNTFIADKSLERKALTGSTAATMASGGADATKGNRFNTPSNSADFVVQTTVNPQNTSSAKEFPSGGDNTDIVGPIVMGSYPNNGMADVSIDQPYVGFGFNEGLQSGTIVSASATTTVTLVPSGTAPAGVAAANLCASVTYNPMAGGSGSFEPPAKCALSAHLSPSASYIFEVGTSTAASQIRDIAGNILDQDGFQAGNQSYSATFTTGAASQTMTMVTPPSVIGSTPMPGSFSIPTNIAKIFVSFSDPMILSSLNSSNITLINRTAGPVVDLSGATFAFAATGSTTLSITLPSVLSASSRYELQITSSAQGYNGIALDHPFFGTFETSASADNSAPTVLGTMPITAGATGVKVNTVSLTVSFDDQIDMTTATSGSVTLGISGGANIPGSVAYDPMNKELRFTANNLLPADSTLLVLTIQKASIKNISGVRMGTSGTYTMSFTTEAANSDSIAPTVLFASADDFGMAVSFSEAVNQSDATNLANYSINAGGTITLSSMAGHTITYDSSRNAAEISGLRLPPATSFTVTASNIRDISGNLMTSSSGQGTTMSYATSGGFLGPGQMTGDYGPPPNTTFTSGTQGMFMPGIDIKAFNSFKSASSTYGFGLPISQQIPASGTVVISFPQSSDFGLGSVATTSSTYFGAGNSDINGPGAGTVGIKTISGSNTAKTITLTLDTATRSASLGGATDTHDFLHFDVLDIKNPSIPKGPDSSGYAVTVTTKNSSDVILETFNAMPVYISGGSFGGVSTTTLRGQVLGANGTVGLNGVRVMLGSPATGPQSMTTAASVWATGQGEFQFTDLPIYNDYMIFTDPMVSPTSAGGTATTTSYFGSSEPRPIRATSTNIHLLNLTLTHIASSKAFTIKVVAPAATFTATEKVDVFTGGPGQFVVNTVTPGAGEWTVASDFATIYIPQVNGMWNIGMGPAMPKDGMFMGPPPSVTWTMPKPINVQMSGCPSACLTTIDGASATSYTFTIAAADKTITGVLKDTSDNVMSGAMVFAYSPAIGVGQNSQTATDGTFTLRVAVGTYSVGAFYPGMGQSKESSVEVTATGNYIDGSKTLSTGATGANPFILKIAKPSYRIEGRVTDGANAIPNASVFAYMTNGVGHANAMTDSSGNYKLYVNNGTWQVGAQLPGYGPLTEKTITVAGASIVGSSPSTGETIGDTNFSPSTTVTYWNISGTVFESNSSTIGSGGIAGVLVNVKSSAGAFYQSKTGVDGTYTIRVPQGNNYTLELEKPGYGRIAALDANLAAIGAFNVTAATIENIRLNTRKTVTINIKDAGGNFVNVPEAFIDLFDTTKNLGNHASIINASSTSIQMANMSSTTVRVFIPSVPANAIAFASDNGAGTTFYDAGSTILNVNGDEIIKVVVNTTLWTISGTIYHTSATPGNEVKDAWVEVVNVASGMHFGTQATSTTGAYSLKLADGAYKIMAVKPGYIMVPLDLTVSANATQNLVLTSASLTIAGQVTAAGSAAANAFVRAEKIGGGFAVTKTDTSGNYTLSVDSGTWRIFAAANNYPQAAYSANPLSVSSSQTGINIALTTAATGIQTTMATSPTFTDTSSGSLTDATVKVNVTVDSGALGQAGSSAYMTAQETVNFIETSSIDVIANKAKEINAYSGDTQVKDLQSGKKATVELTYTTAELATSNIDTPAEVANLKVAAFNIDAQQWEPLSTVATYLDSSGNPLASPATTSASFTAGTASIKFTTNEATHFSTYALTDATDPGAPATPSSVTATAGSAGTNQITVSWSAVTGATGYYLYRDTSESGLFGLLADVGNVTSYTNSGLTANTTYYYKVSAYKSGGASESSASGAVNANTNAAAAAVSFGGMIISGGGGASAPVVPPQIVAQAPAAPTPAGVGVPTPKVVGISPVFTSALKLGMKGLDIKCLQQLLNSDPDTKIAESGIGSAGNETEYFGPATKKALQKFQKKYNIVSSGDENTTGYGALGPKTRTKLAEVFAMAQPAAPTSAEGGVGVPTPKVVGISPVFTSALKLGMIGADVKRLQQLLNSDPDTKIAESGVGSSGKETEYFGSLTEKAVQKFQVKRGIAKEGDSGYGYVGPKTRAKLQEVFKQQ